MPIKSEKELEQAVQEFQRLRDAPADSADGQRREELNAEIQTYYHRNAESLRIAKPPR